MFDYPRVPLQTALQTQFSQSPLRPDRFQMHANAILSSQGYTNPAFPNVQGGMYAPFGAPAPSNMNPCPDRFQKRANAILSSQGYTNPAFPNIQGGMNGPFGARPQGNMQTGSLAPDRFQMKANAILSSQGYTNPAFPHVRGGMYAPFGAPVQAKMNPGSDRFQTHAQSAMSGRTNPCTQHYPSTVRR